MLAVTNLSGFGGFRSPYAVEVLRAAGYGSDLVLCLDPADPRSYSGDQEWTDLSDQASSFYRGASVAAQGSDPRFNGDVGAEGAYWSVDGGDYFRKVNANEDWINDLHKDNALFELYVFFYHQSGSLSRFLGTDGQSSSNVGIRMGVNTSDQLFVVVGDGSGSQTLSQNSGPITFGT